MVGWLRPLLHRASRTRGPGALTSRRGHPPGPGACGAHLSTIPVAVEDLSSGWFGDFYKSKQKGAEVESGPQTKPTLIQVCSLVGPPGL